MGYYSEENGIPLVALTQHNAQYRARIGKHGPEAIVALFFIAKADGKKEWRGRLEKIGGKVWQVGDLRNSPLHIRRPVVSNCTSIDSSE